MDGPEENFAAHDLGEMPQNHYNEEQLNPYSDVPHPYNEEPDNLHNVEEGNPYMQQVSLYSEEPGNQYNEEPSNPDQEESENAYNGEVKQQDGLQVEADKKWPGWPGESVFRILIPAQKVGAIIGRKGDFIKKMCEESKARIKILDGPPGVPERAVMISAKDEPDTPISPAMDGLLRVHKRIAEGSDGDSGNVGPTRLLVPASQAGSLIGKQGATIKLIQDSSKSVVRILETLPLVALNDDRVVEIQGEPVGVHKAVELIASHLRKFLVDRSVLPLFEMQMKMHSVQREQTMPAPQPWGHPQPWGPPSHLPPGGPGYGGNPQFMPPRPQDIYYPPPDVPPMEKQPHYGISAYGREAPTGVSASGNQPPHVASQVTHSMQIPLSYADAVIGAAGASISYIRRHSGATVTIQESRGAPGEMTVEIIGSASQVQTAQQLVQNFMAEAAPQGPPPPASNPPAPPVDPSYGSYAPPYGASYGSAAGAGPAPHNGGSYGGATYPSYGY
ncbi:hypothetical protein E2562_029124 [Oryza meyeriana var. granulata]|uniref:K Homology domain-containing protein n=1 Tax=Oryza meyeriana var. granulata TaxID=110450 RepID=A0A6G1EE60_9ORYZ|nr:hypothetical protein E2562_029124 [Oryza meyeriana var. granulata]